MPYDRNGKSNDLGWPHVCKHTLRGTMVGARRNEGGFTLTELMVVVVILSLLAAISSPLFTKDNAARKGRSWAKIVAPTLQRARFQAMGDRAPIHVMLYRTHVDLYREDPPVPPATNRTYVRLSSIAGPEADVDKTIAIWDARTDNTTPSGQNSNFTTTPTAPSDLGTKQNEIVFLPIGSTLNSLNWRVYIRNELLASGHPDASFVINVRGLTGFVSENDKVVLP
jgi:prepilin-type N-terminal cleavage/methylation domain-containing protein